MVEGVNSFFFGGHIWMVQETAIPALSSLETNVLTGMMILLMRSQFISNVSYSNQFRSMLQRHLARG